MEHEATTTQADEIEDIFQEWHATRKMGYSKDGRSSPTERQQHQLISYIYHKHFTPDSAQLLRNILDGKSYYKLADRYNYSDKDNPTNSTNLDNQIYNPTLTGDPDLNGAYQT